MNQPVVATDATMVAVNGKQNYIRNFSTKKTVIYRAIQSKSIEAIIDYEKRYYALVLDGRKENKETSQKYAKKDELTLLNRVEKYSHNHLLFLHDFPVFFDDNLSNGIFVRRKTVKKWLGVSKK